VAKFNRSKPAVPHLRRGGSIVNTGSVVGLRRRPHLFGSGTFRSPAALTAKR
jgi:NAD(P)-dependent dehydrogenase (short-subunit alcohol dehydrogenase family)